MKNNDKNNTASDRGWAANPLAVLIATVLAILLAFILRECIPSHHPPSKFYEGENPLVIDTSHETISEPSETDAIKASIDTL